jgi:hypothetical protein
MATRIGFPEGDNVLHDMPVVVPLPAGENIGYPGSNPAFPLAPILQVGYILRLDPADNKAYLMDLTNGDLYAGISETAVEISKDEQISSRFWGVVWLAVGDTQVDAGMLVKAQQSSGQAGDIVPWVGHTDSVAGDNVDSIIGRALRTGAVRAGADHTIIPVILRGF